MIKPYSEELVYTMRADGGVLEGALIAPTGDARPTAIIWIHGNLSRFYEAPYVMIGRALAAQGYPFLTGNTHGHDVATAIWRNLQPMPGGCAWERYEDAPIDLAAWVELAARHGYQRVVLAGHSAGGFKVVQYQVQRRDPRVIGLICASPPLHWQPPAEMRAQAERLIGEGRGAALIESDEGPGEWRMVSAATVLSRVQHTADIFDAPRGDPQIRSLAVPLLATYGSEEPGDPAADLATIRRNAADESLITTQIIAGAGHSYWGRTDELATTIARWAEAL